MPIKFETNEQAYSAFYDYFLKYSRENQRFPLVRNTKKAVGIPINKSLKQYDVNLENLELEVLRKRIPEAFAKDSNLSRNELNSELGININNWVEKLGYKTFSELKTHYTGKEVKKKQRVFKTREEAIKAIEDYYLNFLREKQHLPSIMKNLQKDLKIDRTTYVKPKDIKQIKVKVVRQRLQEIFGEKSDRKKNEIESNLGINLDGWLNDLGYKSYFELDSFHTGKMNRQEIIIRRRFVKAMTKGRTFAEKDRTFSTYTNLIIELVRPKNVKETTEEEMWNYIKGKTGEFPNSFDVSNAREYLKITKKIEGNLRQGYWIRE